VLCFLQDKKFEVTLFVILFFSAIRNGAQQPYTSLSLEEVQLVRCLTYISHRYFPPGRSLVISSPPTYRDVQQELITEIHRTAIWPVVVTVGGNISKPEKNDFIDRDGSYIILTPDANINSFVEEIFRLTMGYNTFTPIWNSGTRFVVAGANEFEMWQQMAIFHFFSLLRIYNCIIVSQEHYVVYNEHKRPINVNDVDTSMKLWVYTWFPYQSSDRCTEVDDITLLDSWVASAQGHFTKNTDLFPSKISNSFNGCPMKAFVEDSGSMFTTLLFYQNDSNGNVVRHIDGLEMQLLQIILQQMNMTFVHVATVNGVEMEKITVTNLLRAMYSKEVYIFLGSTLKHEISLSFFDSSNTYCVISIRWYVPCSVKYPRWSSVYRILSVKLWLVLIISIVIAAISTTLVARYSCTSEWQVYKSLTSSLTNLWAVFLSVSVSTMPRVPSVRSLFFAWVCFSLAFNTVIQTFLTTFLIDSGFETPIQSRDELFDSRNMVAYPPGQSYIFQNGDEHEAINVNKNLANCPSYEVCMDWARYRKNVSILMADKDAEKLYADGYFIGENSEPLVCGLEDGVVFNTGLTMVMFSGDPLMRRVNEIIDRVFEAGIYNYWISLRMNIYKLKSQRIALVHPLGEYYSFNLYHMQPAFYLFLMGLCISVLCFVIEVLCNHILRKTK
jgi:hypothetical protein